MVALLKMPFTRMRLDEFLSWDPDDPSGAKWQLIDGEPVAMAPASTPHGEIQAELARLLGNHMLGREPCRVVTEPGVVPRVRADKNYRVPDLAVTCEPPNRDQMLQKPVVLVEILSPSNEVETNSNIWAFTTIPSAMEILSIHSTRIAASLLRRDPDGNWPAEPVEIGADGLLVLDSIGYEVPLLACYRTTFLGRA
jgi:Uma2 family endonuclease